MIWGAFNAFEQMVNFFFQDVQQLSVLATSVRFIPVTVIGLLTSLATGMILTSALTRLETYSPTLPQV